jgi:hypothetical protein
MTMPKNSTFESVARQPAGTKQAATGKQTATVRYVDLPDCEETFADSVNSVFFDGQTMRIEFGITRMDEMKKDAPLTGRRYPACRLVLPPAAAIELINKMQQTAAALEQAGIVKASRKDGSPAAP